VSLTTKLRNQAKKEDSKVETKFTEDCKRQIEPLMDSEETPFFQKFIFVVETQSNFGP